MFGINDTSLLRQRRQCHNR